jgi:DNA-binding IclR family transcriptional regulator
MSKIVKRTLDFIELFAEHKRPLGLSEISKYLDIPVSSCHDVLQSLEERGYVYELGPRAGFYPTLRLQQLVNVITENDPILIRAEIHLRKLREDLDESVSLARVNGTQATYLIVFEPSHRLRFLVRVGDSIRSLYATSAGKALLGTLPPDRRRAAIGKLSFEPFTDNTLRSAEALNADIDLSIERGWYLNREESVQAATTVSSTFSWNRSTFIVTVAGPTFRMEPKFDDVVAGLAQACRSLEAPGGMAT